MLPYDVALLECLHEDIRDVVFVARNEVGGGGAERRPLTIAADRHVCIVSGIRVGEDSVRAHVDASRFTVYDISHEQAIEVGLLSQSVGTSAAVPERDPAAIVARIDRRVRETGREL